MHISVAATPIPRTTLVIELSFNALKSTFTLKTLYRSYVNNSNIKFSCMSSWISTVSPNTGK